MAIDTKLNTVENGVSGIRDAIQNINSNMGKGHINTLDNDIEKLSNQNNFIHKVLKQAVTETTTDPDTGEETTEVTGYDYVNQSEYVGPNYTAIPASKYINNTELSEVIIPDSVTTINNYVFRGCTNLSYINLENIKTINTMAFENCFKNVSFSINDPNLTSIGSGVFYGSGIVKIENLGKITSIPNHVWADSAYKGAFAYCNKLENVVLPNTLKTIGSYAFYNCTNLKTIDLPSTITTINESIFLNCTKLEIDVNLPNLTSMTGPAVFKNSGIKSVSSLGHISTMYSGAGSSSAFYNCTKLTEVTLPDEMINLKAPWFLNCTALTTIHWNSNNITRIDQTFQNTRLEIDDLSLPSLTYLGHSSFINCRIKKISNLGSITAINEYSSSYTSSPFYNCTLLEEITLPSTFTSFSRRSFGKCTSLNKVIMLCTTPPTTVATISSMFENATAAYNACKFYVPYSEDHSVLNAYQTATNWSAVASRIYELNSDGSIPT